MSNDNSSKKIAVIGLGQMGGKIAELYIQKEYDVTVWNRTVEKARLLKASKIAKDAEHALAQNPVIILCVYDNTAVMEILTAVNNKEIFRGKTIINFTTGSPGEVKKLESWLNDLGAHYLNGAIQVAPDQMGLPDTTILMGGNKDAFTFCTKALAVLGGNIKFLGERASSSPAMDMATLSWVHGAYFGMIYGVALCEAEGIKLEDYSTIIGEIAPAFMEFYKHEINMISQGNFSITQSPLSISVIASRRIADTVKSIGLNTSFTNVIADLLQTAKEKGYEQEEAAAVIKVVRRS